MFLQDKIFILKTLYMSVCTFNTLIVTSIPSISKGHVCVFNTFLSPKTYLFPRLVGQGLQGYDVYDNWFSWRQCRDYILASEVTGFSQGLVPS